MLTRLILHSYRTWMVVAFVIATILLLFGYITVAQVLLSLVMALIMAISSLHIDTPLGKAYLMGAWTGIASLAWIWAMIAFIPLLILVLWPLRSRTLKMFSSSLLGLATPWWIYLPYYIFKQL